MGAIHAPVPIVAAAPAVRPAPVAAPIDLLLIEPQFLLRRTVAAVARELRLAHPREVTTIEAGARLLAVRPFQALFLSLDEEESAIELMSRVRQGETRCEATVPIAVTAAACSPQLLMRLKQLEVRRVLLRPFKVKGVLDAIGALRPTAADAPATAA